MGFLRWLDGFLSEELRRAPLEERSRGRVLVGAALSLVLVAASAAATFVVAGLPWTYTAGACGTGAGYAGTLWILRKAPSTRRAAMLLCGVMSSGLILTSAFADDPYLSAHAASMLITVLTVYLLGPRHGLITLVPMLLFVGIGQPLWRQLAGSEPRAPSMGYEWVMHGLAATCIMAGWAVGWLYSTAHAATHSALERDIKARKEAEAKLGELHRTLLDVSRQAGMAEIASGVLHNVGNTLNSVNISLTVATDRVRNSRVSKLVQAAELLREHAWDLEGFLTTDPRGVKLPAYLRALSEQLAAEREELLAELHVLGENVEHVKSIVTMQQKHARLGGVLEWVQVPELINDALRLAAGSLQQLGIQVRCEYAEVPAILVDRHKLLQILLNLLSNARHALVETSTPDKRLTVRVRLGAGGERLCVEVADNGVGIAQENLTRVFSQGFTTKKKGHGFGLHISALAATEMKGRLSAASAGPGEGATFTIELPVQGDEASSSTAPLS